MNNRIVLTGLQISTMEGIRDFPPIVIDIGLDPFYASVHDIEIHFPIEANFSEEFIPRINEIIFNKSIWIDNYLRRKKIGLSPEELYIIKRDYVICATIADIANILYINLSKGGLVKKILGDFTVERESHIEPFGAKNIKDDADQCIQDILEAIDEMSRFTAMTFVLGKCNCKGRRADRLWHHPKFLSKMPIAANKYLESDGRYYKTGEGYGNEYRPLYRRD